MSEFINENADIFDGEKKKQNIFVRILKWLAVSVIILICLLLFYRCVTSSDHPIVKEVLMNDTFYEVYNQYGTDLKVLQYPMQSPWVSIRDGRLIEFNHLHYIPLTQQIQFSFKYNEDLPQCEYDKFPFKLKLVDENGNEYIEYWYKEAQRERYKYARICFENIVLEKDETDENGQKLRHTYKLEISMLDKDGNYNKLCDYMLYDGKNVNREVRYEIKK